LHHDVLTAVDYSRYSSDRQNESSIEAQQAEIDAWAAARHVVIVERYADRALSGRSDHRPEFQRLLSDLRVRKVDYVLVHKTDRFARNRYDAAVYSRVISQRGARLIAVAQDFGDGPEAVILESLMQGMAEYYSLNLATEVIKGRKIRIAKGLHAGGTYPFGYGPDGAGGYAIVELEAHYVRRLYQAVIDGSPPFTHIIAEMRELGVKGRRGRFLSPGNVSTMLKLPIYAGIYEARAGDASSRIDNNHPAIVTKEIYEEAIRIMEARKNVGRRPKKAYLCTGLVRCGLCGAAVYGHTNSKNGKQYVSYICSKSCGLRSIRAEELDAAARDYVAALLCPQVCDQLTHALSVYMDDQREQARRRVPGAKREIAKLESQIEAIMANMTSGVLPPPVLKRLGDQVTDLQSQIEVLRTMIAEPPQIPVDMVRTYFAQACALSDDLPLDAAREVLRTFVASIRVHQHAIEFESTFDGWMRKNLPSLLPSDPRRLVSSPAGGDDPEGGPGPGGGGLSARPAAAPALAVFSAGSPAPSVTPASAPGRDSQNHLLKVSGTARRTARDAAELRPGSRLRRRRTERGQLRRAADTAHHL